MGYFGELDSDLVVIKEICEYIKARYEGKKTPQAFRINKEDYQSNEEKGIVIDNYSYSGIPVAKLLKELGLEGKSLILKDFTFFSYKELFKLYPKIPEILLAIEEHRIKIRPKINELNKKYDEVQEEHKIAKQAIIQFART